MFGIVGEGYDRNDEFLCGGVGTEEKTSFVVRCHFAFLGRRDEHFI